MILAANNRNRSINFVSFFSCLNPIIYGFMSKNFRDSFVSELSYCYRVHVLRSSSSSVAGSGGLRGFTSTSPQDGIALSSRRPSTCVGYTSSNFNAATYERNTRLLRQAGYTVT